MKSGFTIYCQVKQNKQLIYKDYNERCQKNI